MHVMTAIDRYHPDHRHDSYQVCEALSLSSEVHIALGPGTMLLYSIIAHIMYLYSNGIIYRCLVIIILYIFLQLATCMQLANYNTYYYFVLTAC
jgi:hypothetical protein